MTSEPDAFCKLGVIGLGYAGLPQAVAFATAGHPVIGVDTSPAVLAELRAGRSPVDTVEHEVVRALGFQSTVTHDARALDGCSAVVICVPTPLDEDGLPDLRNLIAASEALSDCLRPGQLVVIESTVHPGVTEGVIKPILESSGLRAGVHFSLAFAPERVDPGNPSFAAGNTPRVIGGLTRACAQRTSELYQNVVPSVHLTPGLREAEAAKVLENTYRQINLALVHEFAAYCHAQGIDTTAVIDAAATKPFGFQAFHPGIGVGGHCIPVDPVYLAHSAREIGVPLRLVELAQQINDERPLLVAAQCEDLLRRAGRKVQGAEVLVLGLTYKPNVADVRNTPAVPLIRALTERGMLVTVHDPLVPEIIVDGVCRKSAANLPAAISHADLVLVAQRHKEYRTELLEAAELLYQLDRSQPHG